LNRIYRNTKLFGGRKIFLFLIFLFNNFFSQQTVTGYITDDDGTALSKVVVVNMSTSQKVYSDAGGEFAIEAFPDQELRFVKEGFRRSSKTVLTNGINSRLFITLIPIPRDIGEVKVVRKPTGDLAKDSRMLDREDKAETVRQAVGLPQPKGKMRETPAEVKKVLLPVLLGALDVQGTYDLISGKARRQKRRYRYDDLQEHINWVRSRVDNEYFAEVGIPADKISEFIEFSFVAQPLIRTYVKAKNLSGALLKMEEVIPVFVERLKERKKQE
jgi:hypothetical protein